MKPSEADADRLAKGLHPYLAIEVRPAILDEMGWADFLAKGRPVTNSALTMGCHAFVALGLNGGYPGNRVSILRAVLAFLKEETEIMPAKSELLALATLLNQDPPNANHVHEWFHRNYR